MPKDYDKEYVEGFEDARRVLESANRLLRTVYEQGKAWKESYPWETAEDEEMRKVALNMKRNIERADHARTIVSEGQSRIDKLLKESGER